MSMGQNVHGLKCPWVEMSMGRNVHGSKCPWVEMSMGRNVLGRKRKVREVKLLLLPARSELPCSNYYLPGQYSHGHVITPSSQNIMALPLTMVPDQSSQAPVATYWVSYSNAFLSLLGHKQFNFRV